MQRVGEVTAVRGEMIEVTFCKPEECSACHGCDGQQKASVVTVRGKAQVGDAAVVELPDSTLVRASLLGYILPVVGLLLGILIGMTVIGGDTAAAIGGVLGLAAAASAVALTEKSRRKNPAWQPVLQQIIPKIAE